MTHAVPSLNDSLPDPPNDPPGDPLNASERKTGLRDGVRRFAAMALDALLPPQCRGCSSLVETGGVLCAAAGEVDVLTLARVVRPVA